jgi:HAD superfamily hydrolase (TIGR01459 family)
LSGFAAFAERYDGFILDLWGVIHDGVKPYPGVLDCLARLRAAGKRVVFLSNAPRRPAGIVATLAGMGVSGDLYDGIMSSGEAVFCGLRDGGFGEIGSRVFHLGPARDRDVFEGLGFQEVSQIGGADFCVNTGPDDLRGPSDVSDYVEVLGAGVKAGVVMICANPDLEVVRDGVRIICAGALAEWYAGAGGRVIWRGKPDAAIYAPTLAMLGTERGRTLAVGDSVRTDLAGAQAAGVDAVWVLGGVAGVGVAGADGVLRDAGLRVVGVLEGFAW